MVNLRICLTLRLLVVFFSVSQLTLNCARQGLFGAKNSSESYKVQDIKS